MTRYDQKLLNNPGTVLSSESIPDDMLHGIYRSDLENLSSSLYSDIQNTSMFRDSSMDSMEFQHKIQMFRQLHSSHKPSTNCQRGTHVTTLAQTNKELMEVPTIEFLRECVEDCMRGLQIPVTNYVPNDSWNALFHRMLEEDNLDDEFPPWVLPNCDSVGKNYGHILQVNLQEVAENTMHLTMLESLIEI